MREVKQGIQFTSENREKSTAPDEPASTERKNLVFIKRIEITGKLLTDQTGRFPTTSSLGSKYVMVAHDRDSNTIKVKSLKKK